MSERIKTPRGTFDVLGEAALARAELERTAKGIFERAGYSRIETPTFEATELFARGVGESTDVVQKEMYTFDDGGGGSLTLRPEGTAPVCRAYMEHGMHKLPQPVKLWYLGPYFRAERPQHGRYRQFAQVGVEAIGSDDPAVDAETIVLLAEILEAIKARDLRLRLSSLGTPRHAGRATATSCRATCASTRRGSARRSATASTSTRCARSTPTTPARGEVMAGRAAPARPPERRGPRALRDRQGAARRRRARLRGGSDAGARARLLHAHGVRVHAPTRWARSPGVGGGGRYDGLIEQLGGPHTPGMGWAAGVERMLLAAEPAAGRAAAGRPLRRLRQARVPRPTRSRLAADARRAGYSAQLELAGRSLKGQLKQADRAGARYVAILGDEGTALKDMESGEQRTVETDTVMHHIRR